MAKPSRVVVLVEDERHRQFVRRYLYRLNYLLHDIRFEPLPNGRGCGEQWVREKYANAVAAYRARQARAETALVVAIDSDRGDLNRRMQQLQEALTEKGLPPREAGERIAHFIPRRNIETWVLCLNGRAVDEETDYRREPLAAEEISSAAQVFYAWTRPQARPPQHCVPSLFTAIPEAQRLE